MPTSMAFWDKAADKYDANTVKGPNYAARIDRAAQWLGPDARLLDVGCAGGHITLDLAARVAHAHGIDLSPRLIEIANRRMQEQGVSNARFDAATAEQLPTPPDEQRYDGITAYSLLHLVDDVPATLRRFHELLKPGGTLIAEVPCTEDIPWYLRAVIPPMRWLGKAPVVRLYPQAEYEAMLHDAGFRVDEVKVYNPKSMNRSVLARRA